MPAPLPVLRRDALHAGLATLDAGASSQALEDAYKASLDALPFTDRAVISDLIAAASVTVDRWRTAAIATRNALGHVLACAGNEGRCRACGAAERLVKS